MAGPDRPDRRAARAGHDRPRREVRQAARRLPLGARGAQARRAPPGLAGARAVGRRREHVATRRRRSCSRASTASSFPAASARAGWEGKILACQVARERGIPYLGICLGMHVAVSEFARNVCGLDGANSTEMDPETPFPVIDLLPEQKEIEDLGGTMRLGAQAVELADGTQHARGLRRRRHPRAPPAPLRGEQPLPPARSSRRASSSPAPSRRAGSSRSSSCPTTPGSSRASSTRSSSRGRRGRRRSSGSSSAQRFSARAPAAACGSERPARATRRRWASRCR